MKKKPKQDAQEKKPAKPKRATVKALRTARRRAYYGAQPARTEKNKRWRMRRHLRAHPGDVQTGLQYETRFGGKARDLGLTGRGLKRAKLIWQHQE